MTKPQLTEKVRELIQKSRIVSFDTWRATHSAAAIQRFQAADNEGRYLTDADMQQIHRHFLEPEQRGMLVPYFDHLIEPMKQFR